MLKRVEIIHFVYHNKKTEKRLRLNLMAKTAPFDLTYNF